MAERSLFDDLAAELSSEERRDLLGRIAASSPVSAEPLCKPFERTRADFSDYASRIAAMGFVSRLVLSLRSVFSGKSKESLLREADLRDIARRIDLRFPGLVDRRRPLVLAGVEDELRRLRDSARFFYDILDRSVEKDRSAFFAFLASVEMPELHLRLLAATDPYSVAPTEAGEVELRSAMISAFDQAMLDMGDAGRKAMYRDLRSLIFLKRLSSFLFERLLGAFRPGLGPEGGDAAPFADSRELLLELGDLLCSMSDPPSTALIQTLFVFFESESISRPDAESILASGIARAEAALGRIRAFNARVPMADLSRLVSGDPSRSPRELAGGEDWLAIYRAFWRDRIDARIDQWRLERRARQLGDEIAEFAGPPGPSGFAHISAEETDAAPGIRLEPGLSFIDAFFRGVFARDVARPLKIVLVDGEFYRKDNRLEYTDAYEGLERAPAALAALDARLGPEGEIGSAWIRARSEVVPANVKHRKLQSITRDADEDAERLIRSVGEALAEMVRLLGGLLKGEAGGRYDSVSNLSQLDGRGNKEFIRSLGAAKDRCERALTILAEITGLELAG